MIQLDRDGLTYLLEVCREIGFQVKRLETREEETARPCVTLELVQVHKTEPQIKVPTPAAWKGVSKEQAAEIATKGKTTLLDGTEL